jgi:hypothetical protein
VASGYHVAPGGSFALNLEFAQGQSLLARYERALEAAVGYGGTHIGDRYNLNYLFLVDRRLTLDGGASYGRNTYPEVVDFVLEGTTVDFGVSYLVADRLMVSGALSSWWSSTPGVPTTSGFRANFAVRYGFMWGERAAPPPVDIPTASEPARPPVAEPAK